MVGNSELKVVLNRMRAHGPGRASHGITEPKDES